MKGPLCVGSGLLRGFWRPLGSRGVSPTDGARTAHRLLHTLPLGLLLTCGGFCKMMSLKCKRPFRPFEKPGPLWSPARSLPAGWGGLPKWRSIGVSGRGLRYPSGLLGAHASRLTLSSRRARSAHTRSAAACEPPHPPLTQHFALSCPLLPLSHCPHQNVTVLWPSQLLPPLLCNRITHSLSTSVIMSLRSRDCTSLEFGTCYYCAPRRVV